MNNKIDFSVLLSRSNFDLSQFSPELREFIYDEVGNDRLPLGEIIKRAQSNGNDAAIIEREFQHIKGQLPEIIDQMPLQIKMMIQPLLNMFLSEDN